MRVFHFRGEKTIARCTAGNIQQSQCRSIYHLLTTYIAAPPPDKYRGGCFIFASSGEDANIPPNKKVIRFRSE